METGGYPISNVSKENSVIAADSKIKDINDKEVLQSSETGNEITSEDNPDYIAQYPFYGCAVCNVSYLTLRDLDLHVAIHKDRLTSWDLRVQAREKKRKKKKKEEVKTEQKDSSLEKIFKCGVCLKQFALSYYLRLHVRSHTGEKPYNCDQCDMRFITASKLSRHKRLHSNIKYECRICHKLFSRFEYLTKHFDKKHPEDKLEGEPYDYNTILPYLKELESELAKEKKEEAKTDIWEDDAKVPSREPTPNIIPDEVADIIPEIKVELNYEMESMVKDESDNDCNSDSWEVPQDIWEDQKPAKTKDPNPLVCPECGKTIKSLSYLRIHMRTHTGERPYKCYICSKAFITSSKMHRHVLTHVGPWNETGKKEEVKPTDALIDDVSVKVETVWGDENAENPELDQPPKKARSRKKKLRVKVEGAKRKRPHACEFCSKKFLHMDTLNVHRRSHDGEARVVKCEYCLKQFPEVDEMNAHAKCHSGPNPYTCTICGKRYKRKETLICHRRVHKVEKKYMCDVCSKTFIAPCKLQRHLLCHRPDKFVIRYECPVCAHIFNTKYHMDLHLTTHEKDGMILKKDRGEILAMVLQNARKIPLRTDEATTDVGLPPDERSRICNICGQFFHHFYYLEEHLKTHGTKFSVEKSESDNERPYKCEVCEKGFKLHYYLKLHRFTHTKEKPFVCQQCGKGFITRGKLKRHQESHTGAKKYQCHICSKHFTRPSYLRIHVKTIHSAKMQEFRNKTFMPVSITKNLGLELRTN